MSIFTNMNQNYCQLLGYINEYLDFKAKFNMLSAKVQAHVEQKLKSHELTEAFATSEFVWFAVFIFPFLQNML